MSRRNDACIIFYYRKPFHLAFTDIFDPLENKLLFTAIIRKLERKGVKLYNNKT